MIRCEACSEVLHPRDNEAQCCSACNSTYEAFSYLNANGLLPSHIHDQLEGRPGYDGIFLNVAKTIVEIYETRPEKAH